MLGCDAGLVCRTLVFCCTDLPASSVRTRLSHPAPQRTEPGMVSLWSNSLLRREGRWLSMERRRIGAPLSPYAEVDTRNVHPNADAVALRSRVRYCRRTALGRRAPGSS